MGKVRRGFTKFRRERGSILLAGAGDPFGSSMLGIKEAIHDTKQLFKGIGDTLSPDIPDFPDIDLGAPQISSFEEDEEDDIEFGSGDPKTKKKGKKAFRRQAPTTKGTGLSIGSGSTGVNV
jgi:hypothetical protein